MLARPLLPQLQVLAEGLAGRVQGEGVNEGGRGGGSRRGVQGKEAKERD